MIRQYSDDQGYRHEAEYDANDRPIADRKYDDKGNLVGEGIYKDGKLLGTFYSMTELSRVSEKLFGVKLAQTSISKAVRNKNVYHGFTFSLSDNN